jgi:hypothetical protein
MILFGQLGLLLSIVIGVLYLYEDFFCTITTLLEERKAETHKNTTQFIVNRAFA